MLPNIEILGSAYSWYALFSYLTLFVYSIFFIVYGVKKMGFSVLELFLILYLCTTLGMIGSKAFSVLEKFFISDFSFSQFDFIGDFQNGSGHRWFGSLALILMISPILLIRYSKEKFLSILDLICLGACLSIILGKLGCFFDGHWGCYGVPTNLPWGVTFPYGKAPTSNPVHPIQIYDSIFHTFLFFRLIYRKSRFIGETTMFFLIATSLYNILIEVIRTNHNVFWHLSFAQIIYILIFVAMSVFSLNRFPKQYSELFLDSKHN
jgi:phosphatidylglycerol---prolipoprotein diacylglyceryl transferase